MMTVIFHMPDTRWKHFAALQQPFFMFSLASCICYRRHPDKNIIQKLLASRLQLGRIENSNSYQYQKKSESTLNLIVTVRVVGMQWSIPSVSLENFSIPCMSLLQSCLPKAGNLCSFHHTSLIYFIVGLMVNCYNPKSTSVFESIFHGIAACTVILSSRSYSYESSHII